MDIPIHAAVKCADEVCGHTTHIILNPTNDVVTHVVVRRSDFPGEEVLVPVSMIVDSTPDEVRLRCTREDLDNMQSFVKLEFIEPALPMTMGQGYMMWPYAMPEEGIATLREEQIPPDELAVRRGTPVEASDGHVGHVDEFLIDPASEGITHLVLREGHLWGKRDVTIPVTQIDHIDDLAVHLKLSKRQVEALPTVPIRRRAG
jgi:sporulation protein YlmC with PRC-barrel domain